MTATSPDRTSTPAAPPRERSQWMAVTRLLASEAMNNLLWATGVTLVVMGVGALVAQWRGWELVVVSDPGSISAEITGDGDGVRVVFSLFIVVLAVGIAAVVNQVVLASRARVLVAAGATRRSVAMGLLGTLLAMLAFVLAVTALVLLAVGGGPAGAMSMVGADDAAAVTRATVQSAGVLAMAMAGGSAVVALFQRWPWWVGTIALTVLLTVLPWTVGLAVDGFAPLADVLGWWAFELLAAVVVGAVYWLIARRVPVR